MTILVEKFETLPNGAKSMEFTAEKTAVSIYHGDSFSTVCVKNAAHAVYRKGGRTFHGERRLERAAEEYKSSAVKAILAFAISLAG